MFLSLLLLLHHRSFTHVLKWWWMWLEISFSDQIFQDLSAYGPTCILFYVFPIDSSTKVIDSFSSMNQECVKVSHRKNVVTECVSSFHVSWFRGHNSLPQAPEHSAHVHLRLDSVCIWKNILTMNSHKRMLFRLEMCTFRF